VALLGLLAPRNVDEKAERDAVEDVGIFVLPGAAIQRISSPSMMPKVDLEGSYGRACSLERRTHSVTVSWIDVG
jgi:hypothetical protein